MPEIKNQFTGGKMNKDLDERLIPKGQYRDAMNIQVSTSDESEVGTIQNLLGNKAIDLPIVKESFVLLEDGFKDQIYNCVGCISDEKEDTSYWFLSGEIHSYQEVLDNALVPVSGEYPSLDSFVVRDYIIARSFNETTKSHQQNVVFTDRKRFYSRTVIPDPSNQVVALDNLNKQIHIPFDIISNLSVGDTLTAILSKQAGVYNTQLTNSTIVYIRAAGPGGNNYIVLDNMPLAQPWWIPTESVPYILEFTSKCLQFHHDNLITSINIIDELLFWTDGVNEPKVINIPRSAESTDQDGIIATKLNNPGLGSSLRYVLPHDVQVIKRKPTNKLKVEYSRNVRDGVTKGIATYNFNTSYNLFSAGYSGTMNIQSVTGADELNYEVGDVLLFLNTSDIETGSRTLPYEFDVKLVIEDISFNTINHTHEIKYKIISISSSTPTDVSDFSIVLDERSFEKFENEMVRFSYRYRYLDKEVSAFAPFTDLIFSATKFHYTKDTAYNMGMKNIITDVTLKDFIDVENTLGIESVDLLVKFENSPLVYIIDTIKRSDFPVSVDDAESVFDGEYEFNPKTIKGVVPDNQSLRPFDAVPTSAKAQEVIGNRVVYANYTSSYDFDSTDFKVNIYNNTRPLYEELAPLVGLPSIKSKRNYQVGIVLLDKEGRESPVFSNNDSSIEIPKSSSKETNSFLLENYCTMPSWAKSYKYYIKDTSLPAYNIVVDSFYKAENGDYWIAAPSSDRNKIQEGDFLELKKGIDSDEAVEVNMNTKAISISNEAPEFIATTWRSLGKVNAEYVNRANTTIKLFQYHDYMPQVGARAIRIKKIVWTAQHYEDVDAETNNHSGIGGGNLLEREGINDVSIVFSTKKDPLSGVVGGLKRSQPYNCGRIALEKAFTADGAPNPNNDYYHITLDDPIREEDAWLCTSPTEVADNVVIEISEKIQLPRPRFQGKFFIKIEAQENLKNLIAPTTSDSTIVETILHETPVYNFAEGYGGASSLGSIASGGNNAGTIDITINYDVEGNTTGFASTSVTMDTHDEWEKIFKFRGTNDGDSVGSYWFVDRLQYYRQLKSATVGGRNKVRIESMPDNDWHGSTGQNVYPYIADWSKRHGLGVFISNAKHLINYPEVDAQEPDGQRVPYYAYHDPIGSEAEFYPGTTSVGSPSGFIESEGKFYIELSLIGLFEQMNLDFESLDATGVFYIGGHTEQEHWNVDRDATALDNAPYYDTTINLNNDNQKTLDYLKTENQQFKFEGGTEIFTIKSCNLEWRYNYADGQEAMRHQKRKEEGLTYNQDIIDEFTDPLNRRLTAIIEVDKDPLGYTDNSGTLIDITKSSVANAYTPLKIIFLETKIETESNLGLSTSNPAIFELEKQNEEKLDIYYEASEEIPIQLNANSLKRFIPIGSKITYPKDPSFLSDVTVLNYDHKNLGSAGNTCIIMDNCPNTAAAQSTFNSMVANKEQLAFTTPDGSTVYLTVLAADVAFTFVRRIWVSSTTIGSNCSISLSWYNCFSFGNGVESIYLKDSFNKPFVTKGVKASATLQGDYKTETKTNGLIYSGLYNENSETNNLNQFIMAEKITKEINPTYGSIQKLHARSTADGDLITLCEDRVLKILAEKDAVYNADGNPQLVATENVLGQAIPYSGDYGISTNPESFASESYRCYFTDKVRGVVLRLSKDGLTPISDFGMKDWFRDHLKLSKRLIGSYDSYKKEYNITLNQHPELITGDEGLGTSLFTLSFKENIKGWVSFKSFARMQDGLSCANDYYTYYDNYIWLHHSEGVERNTFYNVFKESTVNVILNDNPGVIKTFHTLNYEGSQGRYEEESSYNTYLPGTNVVNGTFAPTNFKDLYSKSGWYVGTIETDKELGHIRSFVEKEGKWFNYIHGVTGASSEGGLVKSTGPISDTTWQGIGSLVSEPTTATIYGCIDPSAFNYNSTATYDDGSCIPITYGCLDPNADNYNSSANTNDDSCVYPGCIDETANNYNGPPVGNANVDDGSCNYDIFGCTDPNAFNYDATATSSQVSYYDTTDPCIATVYGCIDPTAFNYDMDANTDDGNCVPFTFGCMDANSINYDAAANVDDNTCFVYECNDNTAINYYGGATADTDCIYCDPVTNIQVSHTWSSNSTTNNTELYVSWDPPTDMGAVYSYAVSYATVASDGSVGAFNTPFSSGTLNTNYTLYGLDDNTTYIINVTSACWTGAGTPVMSDFTSNDYIFANSVDTQSSYGIPELIEGCTTPGSFNIDPNANYDDGSCIAVVNGCTDPTAFNYDSSANTDDGSCEPFVYGCTDINAANYNPSANADDGSCYIPASGQIGDGNNDGIVNLADLTLVINNWLQTVPVGQDGDVTGDGFVNLPDLTLVINNWLEYSDAYTQYYENIYFWGIEEEVIDLNPNVTENVELNNGLPLGTDGSGWINATGGDTSYPDVYGYPPPVELYYDPSTGSEIGFLQLRKYPVEYNDPNDPNLQTQGWTPKARAKSIGPGGGYTTGVLEVGKEYTLSYYYQDSTSNSIFKLWLPTVDANGNIIDNSNYETLPMNPGTNNTYTFVATKSQLQFILSPIDPNQIAAVNLAYITCKLSILGVGYAGWKKSRIYAKFSDPNNLDANGNRIPINDTYQPGGPMFIKQMYAGNNPQTNTTTRTFVSHPHTFFNHDFGVPLGAYQMDLANVPVDFTDMLETVNHDSWVTIGDEFDPQEAVSTVGDDGTSALVLPGSNIWEMDDAGSSIFYGGGDDDVPTHAYPDVNGRVLLGQFTYDATQGNLAGVISLQGKFQNPNDSTEMVGWVATGTFGDVSQFDY